MTWSMLQSRVYTASRCSRVGPGVGPLGLCGRCLAMLG